MKRKVLFTLFLLLPLLAVMARENAWRYAKEGTAVLILKKDSDFHYPSNPSSYFKGEKFLFDYTEKGSKVGIGIDSTCGIGIEKTTDPLTIQISLIDYDSLMCTLNINDLYLEDNNLEIDTNIKNSYWIPSYYYALLGSLNVKSDLLEYESHWKNFKNYTSDPDLTWFDFFTVQKYYFGDFYFVYFGKDGYYNDVDFFAYLENVSDTKIVYDVQKMYATGLPYKDQVDFAHPDFIPLYEKEAPFKVILTLDGDYMKMYIDEVSEENLFQILVRTTPEACDQIEKWIKGESDDLSKVVMPRFSSVQKESSAASPTVNISPNKTMTVSENLRLRSEEATTSDILTVLQAGTRVKILEVGKAETIDGISSNWVKVEVQAGAKDRDGKTITKGTVGWCFGGYLKIGEYKESELFDSQETANETESEVKSIFRICIEKISSITGIYFTFIFFIILIVPFVYNTMKIIKSIKARKKGAGGNVPVLSLILICAGCFFSAFAAFCLSVLTAVDGIDVILIIGVIASIFIYIVAGLVTIVGKIRKKKETPGSLIPVIAGEVAMITGILFLLSNAVMSYKQFIPIVMMMTLVVFAAGTMLITAGVLRPNVKEGERQDI